MQQEGAQRLQVTCDFFSDNTNRLLYLKRKILKLRNILFNFIQLLLSGSVSQNRLVAEQSSVNWE